MAAVSSSLVTMLRVVVNDITSPQAFTDGRLEQIIVVSAHYVKEESDFTQSYVVDIANETITPDPIATSTKDDIFTNLLILKSACFVDESNFRTRAAAAGIKAKCGPAMLETLDHIKGFQILLEQGPCKAYQDTRMQYQLGNLQAVRAILSPFVGNIWQPSNHRENRS